MKTAPFDLRTCPSIPAAEARATRAVAQKLAALPRSWQAELPPFGAAILSVAGIDRAPTPAEAIVLAILRGSARGRLSLAQPFAARLVDAALGGRGVFSAARALGPAERGVLVALLAPLLDAIGWSIELGAAPESTVGHAIAVNVEGPFGAGVLWLDLPAPSRELAPAAGSASGGWRERASALPVEARLEIAATHLRASELTRLGLGDALVFDGVDFAAFASETDWVAQLTIGAHAAPLRIDPHGALVLTGDFQLTDATDGRKVGVVQEGKDGKEEPMDVTGPTQMATAALATAPIEIVAELARITLRGEEVLGLAPGVVLTVTADRSRAVLLRAGGEIWAEGELVNVDGELGVRVTRLLRP